MKNIRPVKYVNETVEVTLHPTLEYLVDVVRGIFIKTFVIINYYLSLQDELQESFTALFWFSMLWYDDFLVWNPEDFDGIQILYLPAPFVWRPDLMIYGA